MKPTAINDAIGALRLGVLHLDHPTVIKAAVVRDANAEAIGRLEAYQGQPNAQELPRLYRLLISVTPRGYLPYVTLTTDTERPYGAVVTNQAGDIVARQLGKTVEGLAELIRLQLPHEGNREARA